MRILVAVATCLLMAGCVSINEGMSDIRRWEGPAAKGAQDWVVRASDQGGSAFDRGDPVFITVERLFVSEFDELNFTPGLLMSGNDPFRSRGEIAVLVASSTGSQPISNTTFDSHVVVHYSGDTREGQFSNFRNQIVFGPTEVDGAFLGLEFVLLEIDRPTDQDNALFEQLASLGKGLSGATSGPTFDILAELGTSLLSAPNDDVEMRFRFNFDIGDRPGARLPLAPGRYVLIREEERGYKADTSARRSLRATTDWAELCLDEAGQLRWRDDAQGSECESQNLYVENTYLVLNVEATVPEQTISNQTFAALVDDLQKVENPTSAAFQTALTDAAAEFGARRRAEAVDHGLSQVRARATEFGRLQTQLACDTTLQSRADAAEQALVGEVVGLHSMLADAADSLNDDATDPQGDNDYDLGSYVEQTGRLARFLGEMDWAASPESPITLLAKADEPEHFTLVFGDVSAFYDRVRERAIERWPDCTP